MAKKILTAEDLDQNPELVDQGLKVGDEIDIPDDVPSEENQNNEQQSNEEGEGRGTTTTNPPTGGPNPPPDKGRP